LQGTKDLAEKAAQEGWPGGGAGRGAGPHAAGGPRLLQPLANVVFVEK